MNKQDRFMLVFTLGPVQTFILQARKTRDLWIGSLLFSRLMEAAMDGIKESAFIFPTARTVGEIPDIPNKYIAVFSTIPQAQAAAQQSQRQIAREWQRICHTVWQKIIEKYDDAETRAIWLRQTGVDSSNLATEQVNLNALFDTYWAISERQEKQKYGDWLATTEGLLAARKRLRDFGPQAEPGLKSAISGEREVLRSREISLKEITRFWTNVARKHSSKDLDKEGKERLDAIDTIKRFAMKANAIIIGGQPFQTPFPSTSSIATASFVESLLEDAPGLPSNVFKEWQQITDGKLAQSSMRDIPYLARKATDTTRWFLRNDGDLYFTETFVPNRLRENYDVTDALEGDKLAKRGSTALRGLLRATDALKITRPTPYYAVVQMDGDRMGILLNSVNEEEEHSTISQALSSFARQTVPNIVQDQYPARLVYAGGDDVLAFAPLARDKAEHNQPRHVLELADQLQKQYQVGVIDALPQPPDAKRVERITASAGIVIAHHYTSLSYVLRSAREAEHSAKNDYGRNALVVTLIRRSGEQTRVGCRWRYPDLAEEGQPLTLFSRFYQLFKEDVLSPKCVHILLEEAPALVKLEKERNATNTSNALQSEIKRVLRRQRSPERKDAFQDEKLEACAGYLARLAAAMDADEQAKDRQLQVELHAEKRRYGLVEVLGWLLVMAFLARKEHE